MARKRKPTTNAVEILHRRYYEGNTRRLGDLERARLNAEVARMIYDLREKAGLTQQQLAEMVGTTPSVISRLEDADYEGHSLLMVQRIATALNQRVKLSFVALRQDRRPAARSHRIVAPVDTRA
jgi:ribosome-binding protein aMBF1 (putative translation factor)